VKNEETQVISVRFPSATIRQVDEYAREHRRSRSNIVLLAIELFFGRDVKP
jgi:predicted transcriptional regulator